MSKNDITDKLACRKATTVEHNELKLQDTTQTFITKRESTHLWKILESFKANHPTKNFQSNNCNLILFYEARSSCAFLIGFFVD